MLYTICFIEEGNYYHLATYVNKERALDYMGALENMETSSEFILVEHISNNKDKET